MCAARLLRISAANIGPNRFHQKPDSLVADVDPSLGQEIFDVAEREAPRAFRLTLPSAH